MYFIKNCLSERIHLDVRGSSHLVGSLYESPHTRKERKEEIQVDGRSFPH
jgi:hypothetical protein